MLHIGLFTIPVELLRSTVNNTSWLVCCCIVTITYYNFFMCTCIFTLYFVSTSFPYGCMYVVQKLSAYYYDNKMIYHCSLYTVSYFFELTNAFTPLSTKCFARTVLCYHDIALSPAVRINEVTEVFLIWDRINSLVWYKLADLFEVGWPASRKVISLIHYGSLSLIVDKTRLYNK